ncbi:hypothetical protein F9B74_03760 [Pelistega sp. NLN82]|uniref:Phospholipase/carboxylesterase/thioesterase domain-containing protein n=1 Tax=Pelistega ratti TaxID=2652177 RepID=A0A6L9Y502_9BURK|nr:dienelactone hydrolase family protein [Pelistega ratti]NEN75443.1 hypothetical protein [Pelistega ratti]
MSVFTIERALQPQGGGIAQLFFIFTDQVDTQEMDGFCQTIAKTFPSAGIVVAIPSNALLHYTHIQQKINLSEEDLKAFVSTHQQDIQGFIKSFQSHFQIEPNATALIGIGQMGSLVLELSKLEEPLAGRILSFGARFAELPEEALSLNQTIHFLHAKNDTLVDSQYAIDAHEKLAQLEGDATIDIANNVSNSFNDVLVKQMINRLLTCVPLRYWKEAQQAQVLDTQPATEKDLIH